MVVCLVLVLLSDSWCPFKVSNYLAKEEKAGCFPSCFTLIFVVFVYVLIEPVKPIFFGVKL